VVPSAALCDGLGTGSRKLNDLKDKAIRGGFAKVCAQGANFALRLGSLMILGRLLDPTDFGLVGMVTAVIGVLDLFKDFGLSTATVQRDKITGEQLSTLFWINLAVGVGLAALSMAMAPFIGSFYNEPRLVGVTYVLAAGFVFNAAGVQHSAILQRELRFTASAVVETVTLLLSTTIGVVMALMEFGYWALVVMGVSNPILSTALYWLTTRWIPGKPVRGVGIRSMMRFGGTMTLNSLVVYVAYNLEKVLLGRFWGAAAIGLYGRAYQIINIPTQNLNSAIGGVAFSTLSRVQNDPIRFRSYFLKGYSLVLAITLPVTAACALFADDLILVVLGSKWTAAAPIFRLLAPSIAVFALINPLSWFLFSLGLVDRSLKVALVLAPLVITGYLVGLPHGPTGVALGYSLVLVLWVVPHVAWCVHDTVISLRDIFVTLSPPMLSTLIGATLAFAVQFVWGPPLSPMLRLLLGGSVLMSVYAGILLFVMRQKPFYLELLRTLRGRPSGEEKVLVSA
jgi:PST family polysaccharide transporter